MTKYDLAKLFSEVDDKYIESARPEAQKAVMLKTRKAPMRIIAAASCAAVLAGGVVTAAALLNGKINTPGNSNTASITSGGLANSGSTVPLDEKTGNWFDDEQICYEGEYYTLIKEASARYIHITADEWAVGYAAGIRINDDNKIELVAVIVNISDKPLGMLDYGDGRVLELGFHKKSESDPPAISGLDVERPIAKVLQPGEELYQKQTFDLFYGECWGSLQFDYTGVNGETVCGTDIQQCIFKGEMTENGFDEHHRFENWYDSEQIYYEGRYYKVPEDIRDNNSSDPSRKVIAWAGLRRSSEKTVEMVTVLKNNYTEPVAIRGCGADFAAEITFEPKPDYDPDKVPRSSNDMSEKPIAVILQPGEEYYQLSTFNVGYGEYMGEIEFAYKNADPGLVQSFGGSQLYIFYEKITEDGYDQPISRENSFNEEWIHYDGEYYRVVECRNFADLPIQYMVGMRLDTENNKIEAAALLRNRDPGLVKIRSCDPYSAVELNLAPKPEKEPNADYNDNMTEKPYTVTLKQGEVYYQRATFDLFYGEYLGDISFAYEYSTDDGTFESPVHGIFRGAIATDGFKNPYDADKSADKVLTPEEWAQKPLVLPSKFAPKDLDFVNTGNGRHSQNTLIPADKGSEVYAVDGGEVIFADYSGMWNSRFGSVVVIKHGEGLNTVYAGLTPVERGGKAYVSAGDTVKAGSVIGLAEWSGYQLKYGVRYGFYTELPEFFAEKLSGTPNGNSSSGGGELDAAASEASKDDMPSIVIGNIDLTVDLDGDGIPDGLKEINPDITLEDWEELKSRNLIL